MRIYSALIEVLCTMGQWDKWTLESDVKKKDDFFKTTTQASIFIKRFLLGNGAIEGSEAGVVVTD